MNYRYQHLKYGSYQEILSSYHDPIGGRTLCCAHRSYWRMYPENSVLAILAAIDYGCDMVEVDVRVTKDGVCVLSHDNNLGRCTNAPADMAKLNLDEIGYDQIKDLKLRFGTGGKNTMISDERICLFEEALLLCENKILVNLDKVMEDERLRECTYQTMLKLERQGHHPFEFCVFKCGKQSLANVLAWIKEKETCDGVKINYAPWGIQGAEYLIEHGYRPYLFEYKIDCSAELAYRKNALKVGYMANTFDDSGDDDTDHWNSVMKCGANVIHSDDARLCPQAVRAYWAEHYTVKDGVLFRYSGPCGDMVIPNGIRVIASGAFSGFMDLESVILPESVEKVESGAFGGCSGLKIAVLKGKSVLVGAEAFPKDTILCSFKDAVGVEVRTEHRRIPFSEECGLYTYSFRKGKVILERYLGDEAEIIVPDTLLGLPVYEIGRNCFAGTDIISVQIGKQIERIERCAFQGCRHLRRVVFARSVKSISIDAFDQCDRMLKVISPVGSYPNRYARAKGIRCECPDGVSAVNVPFSGSGTCECPYLISTTEDLIALSGILKSDCRNFFANACYLQTSDLDFTEEQAKDFSPVGQDGAVFRGIFDGAGYTVSGMHIQSEEEGVSLFGYINGAEIRNVNISGISVTASAYIGGIVGIAESSLIENCHVRNFSLIATNTDHCNIGGAVGVALHSVVKNCSAVGGSVKGYRDLGGFMGEANHSEVVNCFADDVSDLQAQGNSCGGFVGNFKGASRFERCFTAVNVSGALRIGSFSGFSGGDRRAEMKQCLALGNVGSCRRETHGGLTGARVANVVDCYYSDRVEHIDCCQGTAVAPDVACTAAFFHELGISLDALQKDTALRNRI